MVPKNFNSEHSMDEWTNRGIIYTACCEVMEIDRRARLHIYVIHQK